MKISLLIIMLISSLFAEDVLKNKETYKYPYKDTLYVKMYVDKIGGVIDFDLANKLNVDMNWLKGNDFINNHKYKKNLTSPSINNHNKNDKNYKGTTKFLETYKKVRKVINKITTSKSKEALYQFSKSANNNNPVAAYEGLSILFDYYPNNIEMNLRYRKQFAKVLMNNDICLGYLTLGNIYREGYLETKDIKKALNIYMLGENSCKKENVSRWQLMQLTQHMVKIQYQMGLITPKPYKKRVKI